MGAFFTAILSKIVALAVWIGALVVAMYAAWWLLGTDLGCWLFESLMDVVIAALNAVNIDFSVFNPAQYISGASPELVNMMGLMRIGEALAIILAAVLLKIALQVIPFTRLGS